MQVFRPRHRRPKPTQQLLSRLVLRSQFGMSGHKSCLNSFFKQLVLFCSGHQKNHTGLTFQITIFPSSFVCQVVYIVEKKHSRAVTGFLKFLPDKPFAMFSPVDHRVPRINVLLADCPEDFTSRPGDYTNTLFICRITNWAADSNFAEG